MTLHIKSVSNNIPNVSSLSNQLYYLILYQRQQTHCILSKWFIWKRCKLSLEQLTLYLFNHLQQHPEPWGSWPFSGPHGPSSGPESAWHGSTYQHNIHQWWEKKHLVVKNSPKKKKKNTNYKHLTCNCCK